MFPGLEGFDPAQVVACALRPQSSWLHLATLLGFVLAAYHVGATSQRPPARARRTR